MHQALSLRSGKLPAKAALSSTHLTTQPAATPAASRVRSRRSLSQRVGRLMAGVALAASAALVPPTAQAQTFKAIPLDGGGHTSGFAQSAQSPNRIYAFGDVFGAWRSDNKGTTWEYLNWSIPGGDIVGMGMAAQQDNANIVYYLTPNSFYKSTNSGTSWNKLLSDINWGAQQPKEYQRVRGATHILINSNNADELWLASPRSSQTGTLWKKSANSTTWTKMGGSTFDVSTNRALTLFQSPVNPSQIWVGTEKGLYVTADGGSNFRKIISSNETNLPTADMINVGMIKQFTATGTHRGVLLVNYGKFCCSNNGVARITASNYSDITTYTAARPTQVNMGYPTGLQVFSNNTAVAWNTAGDVQGYSTDGGQTFNERATILNHTDANRVPIWTTAATMDAKDHPDYGTDQVIEVAGSNGTHWIITGGGAAMESTDSGVTWSYFPNGSGIAGVKTYPAGVSRHSDNRMYVPGSDIGMVIVTDGGASGKAQRSSTKTQAYLHGAFRVMEGADTNNLVIAGVHQQNNANLLLKSSNGGANWTPTSLSGSGLPLSWDGITKSVMALNNTNDFLVALASSANSSSAPASSINPGVWRTTTGGSSFFKVSGVTNGLPGNLQLGHRYDPQSSFLERDATLVNRRYFVSRHINNSPTASTAFYRSDDGGTTWSATANHPFGLGTWVWGLTADPVRSGNLWAAGAGGGVSYSTNGGDTWTGTGSTNNSNYFDSRHVGAYDGKIAVWGRRGGEPNPEHLWYSPDNGATWYQQTTASKNFHGVQGITVDSRGRIWVSWNSITVVTPVTGPTLGSAADLGFENDFTNWDEYGTASIKTDNVRAGSKSGYFVGASNTTAGANYTLTGLTAGATYKVKAWVKAVSGSNIWVTAAPVGGSQVGKQALSATTTNWTQVEFTLSMGTATSARVSAWVGNNSSAYFDDFTVEACSNCRLASAESSGPETASLTLNLHPNPASRRVTLSLAGFGEESSVQVKLSDVTGKAFTGKQVQLRAGAGQVTLPVSHLPRGLYVVTVQGSKTAKTARLILTR